MPTQSALLNSKKMKMLMMGLMELVRVRMMERAAMKEMTRKETKTNQRSQGARCPCG